MLILCPVPAAGFFGGFPNSSLIADRSRSFESVRDSWAATAQIGGVCLAVVGHEACQSLCRPANFEPPHHPTQITTHPRLESPVGSRGRGGGVR